MKKFVLFMLFLSALLQAKATGGTPDVIYLDGESWSLLSEPIYADSILVARVEQLLPDNVNRSFGDLDGWQAYWELRDDNLYLLYLKVNLWDKEARKDSTLVLGIEDLKEAFSPYYARGRICARWYSGTFRAGKGEVLLDGLYGFDYNFETERFLTFQQGKLMSSTVYHNYKIGQNAMVAWADINLQFPWEEFPEYRGCRICFVISHPQLTDAGRLLDVRIDKMEVSKGEYGSKDFKMFLKMDSPSSDHPLVKIFRDFMKSFYPWEVFFINGKFIKTIPPRFVVSEGVKEDARKWRSMFSK